MVGVSHWRHFGAMCIHLQWTIHHDVQSPSAKSLPFFVGLRLWDTSKIYEVTDPAGWFLSLGSLVSQLSAVPDCQIQSLNWIWHIRTPNTGSSVHFETTSTLGSAFGCILLGIERDFRQDSSGCLSQPQGQ